jgi:4-carboxymuconolactone decarboxylase
MTRQELRHQSEAMLRTLFGSTTQPAGLANLLTEAAYGGIWSRPGLSIPDRLVCSIAALGAGPRLTALRRHLGAALDHGLTAEAIREILVQASLYSGFSAAEETLPLAGEVFAERGIQFPANPPEDASLQELDRRGAALMAVLHGSRATQGYAAPDNSVAGQLYPSAIRYGYGEIWSRPGLEHRQRALVAVAAFTALRLPEQVAKFGQSALNIGLTKTQV